MGNLKQVSTFWNVCAVAGIYQHVFTEGTINRVAAVLGVVAQCFPTGAAVLTDTTGGPQPDVTNEVTDLDGVLTGAELDHFTHALVAGDEGQTWLDRPVALSCVQVGVAHT